MKMHAGLRESARLTHAGFLLLAVLAGLLVVALTPLYAAALAVAAALLYLALRRPHWIMFGLLLVKASLDNVSQTVTFFEGTPLAVNINGAMNVAVVAFAVAAVAGGYAPLRGLPATRPYLLLLSIGALGLAVSLYPMDTLREWFRLASPFAIYVLMSGVARRQAGVKWFVALVALSALVPVTLGLYQALSGSGFAITVGFNRAYGTFWFPTSFGYYLLVLLMLAIPQFRVSRRAVQRLVILLVIGICGVTLLLTYTRAAWIGLTLAAGLFALFCYRRLLLIGCATLAIVVLAVPSATQRFADLSAPETFSLEGTAVGAASALGAINSVQWRLILWSDMAQFVPTRPLLGYGLGSAANLAATTRIALRMAPHNEFLRILVETGVVGLIAFLWLHASVLRGAWHIYRQHRSGWQSIFAIAFASLYAAIVIVSFTDNILSFHTLGWYIWAYAAVVHQL